MTISTIAYAHDELGKLAAFKIEKADKLRSYKAVIEAVKAETGAPRAMCLVISQPAAAAAKPTDEQEVA